MDDNFAIPGFQRPTHPKQDLNVTAGMDGRVEFPFLENIPLESKMPHIDVYLSNQLGTDIFNLAKLIHGQFIYEQKDEDRNLKAYWIKILPSELAILPGTYRLRFVVDELEVALKSLTVPQGPLAQRVFPEQAFPNGPLVL